MKNKYLEQLLVTIARIGNEELFLDFHSQAGPKFHGEFVLEDSDFFNQPPDKGLVIFGNSCRLFL